MLEDAAGAIVADDARQDPDDGGDETGALLVLPPERDSGLVVKGLKVPKRNTFWPNRADCVHKRRPSAFDVRKQGSQHVEGPYLSLLWTAEPQYVERLRRPENGLAGEG